MGWEVFPDGLHRLLVRVARTTRRPKIYVTENGAAFPDIRATTAASTIRSGSRTSSRTSTR